MSAQTVRRALGQSWQAGEPIVLRDGAETVTIAGKLIDNLLRGTGIRCGEYQRGVYGTVWRNLPTTIGCSRQPTDTIVP